MHLIFDHVIKNFMLLSDIEKVVCSIYTYRQVDE